MQVNRKSNTAVISIDNLSDIFMALGAEGKKAAISRAEKCISETLGEVCDVYHIKDNTFVCVSTIDIRGYISQFKDAVGFSEIKEKYPLKVTVKYENDAL
jgi:putative heme degradation protein